MSFEPSLSTSFNDTQCFDRYRPRSDFGSVKGPKFKVLKR